MTVDDVQTGMILNWQSDMWPNKKSRWIVLEQLEHGAIEGRKFNLYCIQSSLNPEYSSRVVPHLFRDDQIHKWTVHSQI